MQNLEDGNKRIISQFGLEHPWFESKWEYKSCQNSKIRIVLATYKCPSVGTGRHLGLRNQGPKGRASSSLAWGTKKCPVYYEKNWTK